MSDTCIKKPGQYYFTNQNKKTISSLKISKPRHFHSLTRSILPLPSAIFLPHCVIVKRTAAPPAYNSRSKYLQTGYHFYIYIYIYICLFSYMQLIEFFFINNFFRWRFSCLWGLRSIRISSFWYIEYSWEECINKWEILSGVNSCPRLLVFNGWFGYLPKFFVT